MRIQLLSRTLLPLALISLGSVSHAHEHYFTYTYDWFTPFQYEREVEFFTTHFEGGVSQQQLEFEYGVTDRYVVAPYILFNTENGRTKFNGWKFEQRYRFGDRAHRKLLPAIYLEIKKEEDEETAEIEGKLIGSYLPNKDWVISGNLIFERHLETGARTEIGYSLGTARKLTPDQHIGFEAFGNWLENEHFVGPSFGFGKPHSVKVLGTAAMPVAGGGPFQFRLVFEHEF
jgi:hypothetical protein